MKYEYKVLDLTPDHSANDAEAAFNQLSAEGWRMVRYVDALSRSSWAARVIFEREATPAGLLPAATPNLPGPLPYVPNAIPTQPKDSRRLQWAVCRGKRIEVGELWEQFGFSVFLRVRVTDIVADGPHTYIITETSTEGGKANKPKRKKRKSHYMIEEFLRKFEKVEE